MNYVRLYNDSSGESRFSDLDFVFSAADFAPPAPPVDVSDPISATAFMIIRLPKGWADPAHPAPARQFMMVMQGMAEITAGRERRLLKSGDILLAEDTAGEGHATSVLEDSVLAVVRVG
jgi:quercetin dioxygenase-like cupin family protein